MVYRLLLGWFLIVGLATGLARGEDKKGGVEGPPKKRLVIFGDSITAGYGVEKNQAFPALLQKKIDAGGGGWDVMNAGVSGNTSADGLARLKWVLKRKPEVFLLALGGNDGLRGLAPEEMKKNLAAIIDQARKSHPGVTILLAGMQMPDSMGKDYQKKFEQVFSDLAKEKKTGQIPFLLKGVAGEADLNLEDRIHPNEPGHVIIADHVWSILEGVLFPKTKKAA